VGQEDQEQPEGHDKQIAKLEEKFLHALVS
jgi:hypothetical protein